MGDTPLLGRIGAALRPFRGSLFVVSFGALLGASLSLLDAGKPERTQEVAAAQGDPDRGLRLMAEFECTRCHDASFLPASPPERHCSGCHRKIMNGSFAAPAGALARFRAHIHHLTELPSLDATASRFRRSWVAQFLQRPHDLRPGLQETMPRLPLSERDAIDIASYLAPHEGQAEVDFGGDISQGRELFAQRGCTRCHSFSGIVESADVSGEAPVARKLAPDLLQTRSRFRLENLVNWLRAPENLAPNTLMPNHGLSEAEARDLATFLVLSVPHKEEAEKRMRLQSPITREVFFEEVNERVLRKTCWHCHSDPDFSRGDDGPGNEGGFGFAGVGLNLGSYEGVLGGAYPGGASVLTSVLEERQRETIVDVDTPARSRLLRALRARKIEESGGVVEGVRGMPLGLPALPDEDIALVEAWIAQGARY